MEMGAVAPSEHIVEYSVGTLADLPTPPMPAGGKRGSSFVSSLPYAIIDIFGRVA